MRALNPNPVAWTTYRGKRIKIYSVRPAEKVYQGAAGQVVEVTKKSVAEEKSNKAKYWANEYGVFKKLRNVTFGVFRQGVFVNRAK